MRSFKENPVVLLAGGLGTRLRPAIGDLPKVMAPVSGRPFLEHMLHELHKNNYTRVILSLGYGADSVLDYLRSSRWSAPFLQCLRETEPLGTGGALLHVLRETGLSGPVIVANADTWIENAWPQLASLSPGTASVGVVPMSDVSRYGEVSLDNTKTRVLQFLEKTGEPRPGLIYSGIALLSRGDLDDQPAPIFSLEQDVLPRMAAVGKLNAFCFQGRLTDIGVPADYEAFCRSFRK